MMNIKGIFAVSLIAMVAVVAGAHTSNAVAAIASKGYVDQQVGLKANATELERKVDIYQGDAKANQAVITNGTGNITTGFITKSMLGADVEIPAAITVDSALSSTSTNPVQNKVINTALAGKQATLSAAQLNAVNSGITLNKVSTYDGYNEKITAAQNAANAKVAIAQGSAAINKAVITNASGNITTGTISSAMITDGTITNADISASAAIATSKISGLATVATTGSYDDLIDQPTIPTVNNGQLTINVNGTSHSFTANQAGGTTVDIDIPDEVDFSGLSGSTTGGGNVVTNVTQTNGKVSAFKGITAEVASNRVTSANFDSNTSNDTKYPTVKAVADAIADNIHNATLTIKKNGESVGTFTANASADKEIDIEVPDAGDILTTTTVTSSGTGAVLTGVSVTPGKVTLQKGNVQIPSGGQNATSYVSIWVE